MHCEIRYVDGCPGFEPLKVMLEDVLGRFGVDVKPVMRLVGSGKEAESLDFRGSPSLLIDGRDIEDSGAPEGDPSCRLHGGNPTPDRWLVESAVLRSLKPNTVLFMCVQNSARSQLAESIGRSMAPPGVTILSAGSKPAFVRPQALQVLEEGGFPTDDLSSKGVDDLDTSDVEAVITLCADEVCPVYLGKAWRCHWGLPDPAGIEGEEARIDAFRRTRDELEMRLKHLFDWR